jgi:hypothetical protein
MNAINRNNKPKEWQRNPDHLKTSRVQYWRNGIMVTAQMTLETAQQVVQDGQAFVICEQAIGALTADGEYNS